MAANREKSSRQMQRDHILINHVISNTTLPGLVCITHEKGSVTKMSHPVHTRVSFLLRNLIAPGLVQFCLQLSSRSGPVSPAFNNPHANPSSAAGRPFHQPGIRIQTSPPQQWPQPATANTEKSTKKFCYFWIVTLSVWFLKIE